MQGGRKHQGDIKGTSGGHQGELNNHILSARSWSQRETKNPDATKPRAFQSHTLQRVSSKETINNRQHSNRSARHSVLLQADIATSAPGIQQGVCLVRIKVGWKDR